MRLNKALESAEYVSIKSFTSIVHKGFKWVLLWYLFSFGYGVLVNILAGTNLTDVPAIGIATLIILPWILLITIAWLLCMNYIYILKNRIIGYTTLTGHIDLSISDIYSCKLERRYLFLELKDSKVIISSVINISELYHTLIEKGIMPTGD